MKRAPARAMLAHMRDVSGRMARVERALERDSRLRAISDDPNETWLWQNHDLANLMENRLDLRKDPLAMTDADRDLYGPRVTADGLRIAAPKARESLAFWILDGRRRVGTVAVLRAPSPDGLLRISSLYVLPQHRGRGHATRVLDAVHARALDAGLAGTLLSTEWCWQRAVRFYLRRGMWVWGWNDAIEFARHRELPQWLMEEDAQGARFVSVRGDSRSLLIEAKRVRDGLEWLERAHDSGGAMDRAPGTFALSLAARGWPLVLARAESPSAERRAPHRGPVDLALKIREFEAHARRYGWHVDTPQSRGE